MLEYTPYAMALLELGKNQEEEKDIWNNYVKSQIFLILYLN